MEIMSIIPARGGSKGIPRKNLKEINNKPLIAYSIEASLNSKYITKTVLSTEDLEIKNEALKYGAFVIDRPCNLALDQTKTAPVILDTLDQLEQKYSYTPDIVVLLQPTCPLRTAFDIDNAFDLFFQSKCDSVFSALPLGYTHSKWRELPNGKMEAIYDFRNRPRRQDLDKHYKMFTETGSIYIIKTDVLKKVKDFIGENPKVYLETSCLDIDTLDDFHKAEEFFKSNI